MSIETEIQNLTSAVENLAFIIKQLNVTQAAQPIKTENLYGPLRNGVDLPKNENLYAPLRTDAEVNDVNNKVMVDPRLKNPVRVEEPILAPAQSVFIPQVTTAPVMPAPPTFEQQITLSTNSAFTKAPFTDPKGLMDYLMKRYSELGAEKGAKIQDVLKSLGVSTVNEVKVEQYDALFAGVEDLK